MIDFALNPGLCDLFIEGNLVNVITSEIYKSTIGIKQGKIVFIGDKQEINFKSEKLKNFMKTDGFLLPSFIDSHIHIESSMLIPSEFAKLSVVNGTCCVIADPHEIANVLGIKGIEFMLNDAKNLPMEIYYMIPSCVPAAPNLETSEKLTVEDLKKLKKLKSKKILGLAELMNFQGVINKDIEILKKIKIFKNKIIDGHCPGLIGKELNAYLLVAKSDHESIFSEEFIEKLRKGMFLMIREGSAATQDILKFLLENKISFYNVSFVSDDIHAEDLKKGHLNLVLKKAVKEGMDEIEAIRAVTLNPARYFKLNSVGAIAIGKQANITIVDNLYNFNVKKVFFKGRLVAENGKLIAKIKKQSKENNIQNFNIMNVKEISENNFKIYVKEDKKYNVRVIECIDGKLFTKEKIVELRAKNKILEPDIEKDIIKISVIDRHKGKNLSVGFINGFGIRDGAIAQTIAHDSHNIIVIGTSDKSMEKACKEIIKIGGGIVLYIESKNEIYHLSLPFAGLMSDNYNYVIEKLEILNEKVKELNCKMKSPFMTLSFMALPVIPELKITDKGLVKNFKFENLIQK